MSSEHERSEMKARFLKKLAEVFIEFKKHDPMAQFDLDTELIPFLRKSPALGAMLPAFKSGVGRAYLLNLLTETPSKFWVISNGKHVTVDLAEQPRQYKRSAKRGRTKKTKTRRGK